MMNLHRESFGTPPAENTDVLPLRYKERTDSETPGFPLAKNIGSMSFNRNKGIE